MKALHITLMVLVSILLTSCEQLGIEITTVKGEWKSQDYKNNKNLYVIMSLSDNGISYQSIHNDSILVSSRIGTWSLHNDTLTLYHQDFNANGVRQFKIEQMSMNTLTLRNIATKDIWVMNRQYSTANKDYDSHFSEVFNLKKSFWWYAWKITQFVLGVIMLCAISGGIIMGVSDLLKWIRKLIK